MVVSMTHPATSELAANVVMRLRGLGYSNSLLQEDYAFPDWFTEANEERQLLAAAFGQTPISYDSALIGVALANGLSGHSLVNSLRALGAPVLLEINGDEVREWAVSRSESEHLLIGAYRANEVQRLFVERGAEWRPEALLRSKNIGSFVWHRQLGLFDGLVPELESQIQSKLDPLLRDALATTETAYRETSGKSPSPESLFKLVFWLLTAKVFSDRRVPGFEHLAHDPDPDKLIGAVATHYKEAIPMLLNRRSRHVAASKIWTNLDFRHLSVDVLAQIWSDTLVDRVARKRLGIHRTPRSVVRYMVERTPLTMTGDDTKIVFEPCCGSASFLIGAMAHLRQQLFGMSPEERHTYFGRHLAGAEQEPFGIEISKLALTLSDFPNPDGWDIKPMDVFQDGAMAAQLRSSAVVFCNPPFEEFSEDQRRQYKLSTVLKPAELLNRVLFGLHPDGVIGFVLPRLFIDGKLYASTREAVAKRFAKIELTILPDRVFNADAEIAVLIASDPRPHDVTRVDFRTVKDDADSWMEFERRYAVSSQNSATLSPAEARASLLVPELPNVWEHLRDNQRLRQFVDGIHRGLRWNEPMTSQDPKTRKRVETGKRLEYELENEEPGYLRGVASNTKFTVFEVPRLKFLSIRKEHRSTNAWRLPWGKPKVIYGKSARSRGRWRLVAFPDSAGVSCYQTYVAIWPKDGAYDEVVLAAILNSPVANAFIATREGKTDITMETVEAIPMPALSVKQVDRIRLLVENYQSAIQPGLIGNVPATVDPELLLKEVDAIVLEGYDLPPRLEKELLEFFSGEERQTAHPFGDYIPAGCDLAFSLSRFLAPNFGGLTPAEFLRLTGN